MNLNQLKYFVEVCRCGSVTKAAAELHMSQPSLSNVIKELETEFNVLLFERINGRLHITHAGENLFYKGIELLNMSDELVHSMKVGDLKKRKIRIGITPMISAFIFPIISRDFHKLYPDTQFECIEHGALEIYKMLRNEQLDLAITLTSIAENDNHLEACPLIRSQYCLCTNKSNPLSNKAAISIEDIKYTPLALLNGNIYHVKSLYERFEKEKLTPIVTTTTSQIHTITKLVINGDACTFLLKEIADVEPSIVAIPLAEPMPAEISLVFNKNSKPSVRTTKLIAFIKDNYN